MRPGTKTALCKPEDSPFIAAEPLFWGRWCGIDMRDCDLSIISDRDSVARYIEELCDLLKFRRYGPSTIVRFGKRPEIAGFSFTQLIETSLV